MQDGGDGVKGDGGVRDDSGVVPAFVLSPVDSDHVVGAVVPESRVCQNFGEAFRRGGVAGAFYVKNQICHVHQGTPSGVVWSGGSLLLR